MFQVEVVGQRHGPSEIQKANFVSSSTSNYSRKLLNVKLSKINILDSFVIIKNETYFEYIFLQYSFKISENQIVPTV